MDKKIVLGIISRFRRAVESRGIKITKLILFGSYASGIYRKGSDIDVVVVSDDFAEKNYWERIEILSDAIYELFEPIEAIAVTSDEWERGASPVTEYAKNGKLIYKA